MARVNVEERAFVKAYELASLMGWDQKTAMGALVFLWNGSQGKIKLSGTAKEIAKWSRVFEDADRYIDSLVECEFISPEITDNEERTFKIAGNEDQLDGIVKHLTKSKRGGDANRQRWESIKSKRSSGATGYPVAMPQASHKLATAMPQDSHRIATAKPIALHCSCIALHCSCIALQKDKEKIIDFRSSEAMQQKDEATGQQPELEIPGSTTAPAILPEAIAAPTSEKKSADRGKVASAKSTPVWEAFKTAYSARYKARDGLPLEPIRNREVNVACCQLIEKLGVELATQVVIFYVAHNDQFYVRSGHDLRIAVSNAQKLSTELRSGRTVTTGTARQIERTSNNAQVWGNLLDKEGLK